ncbi:MAG: hypothetical protein GY856_44520 [bacterium]|nr:hypothetical protein [bacterium]
MKRSLVTDASCLLNLLASGRVDEILDVLEVELVATPHLRGEVLYLAGPRESTGAVTKERVDLSPLESAGLLQIRPLDEAALEHLVRCSEQLRDAAAAGVALSAALELPLATDDGRQRNVARELYPRLELVSPLELVRPAVERLGLDHAAVHQLARDIRLRASFLPPKRDPHREWFRTLLDEPDT